MAEDDREEKTTITTTIEIDKDVFLRFKAWCVINEKTISGEVENLLRKKVEEMPEVNSLVKENGN